MERSAAGSRNLFAKLQDRAQAEAALHHQRFANLDAALAAGHLAVLATALREIAAQYLRAGRESVPLRGRQGGFAQSPQRQCLAAGERGGFVHDPSGAAEIWRAVGSGAGGVSAIRQMVQISDGV